MERAIDLIREDLANIEKVVSIYEQDLAGFEDHLRLSGKNIIKANEEQPSWLSFYDSHRVELKSITEYMDLQVQKTRGKLWRDYTENYSRDLQTKDKEQYINHEPTFIFMYQLYLEVKELYEKYVSVVESFKARGFILNNLTRLISTETVDYIIS